MARAFGDVAVVIPTYNERDNIDGLLAALLALPYSIHPIVVDDASPDGTGLAAEEWSKRASRVQVVHRPRKLGLGTAHLAGFDLALNQGFERTLTMDADFSHDPAFIPAILEATERFDVVIGSRYVPGGGTTRCTLPRRALSHGANSFARLALGFKTRDCTAGFRCYRRNVLASLDRPSIVANGYSFLIEILYRASRAGFSIGEVPIVFDDRRFGTSKISRAEVGRAIGTVLRLWKQRVLASHPEQSAR